MDKRMDEGHHKQPSLLFFQFQYDDRLSPFLLTHKQEHVACLSHFFDVTVINQDCDYKEICDAYEPALALFESGVNHATCRRLKIENARSYTQVPKIGLHHGDAFCNARAGFLSDMEQWGIDTFFAISTTAAEHTPEIASHLFTWPVFIDPIIYRDYGIWKGIPVLFTGNRNALYPWRNQLWRRISDHYGTLTWPHPGYGTGTPAARILMGEDYARTINSAWFVPACGTIAKDVVRKHFEVPACRTCLVTEQSPALQAAGFADMKNCVFADAHDVLDKLDYLLRNRDVLTEITDAGYRLVHSRHRMEHRDQIYQWFGLHANLKPHQTIVQDGPFESLRVVAKEAGVQRIHISSNGSHLALIRKGDEHFLRGQYEHAEQCYLKCTFYMPWMPEPKLRLALCRLHRGEPGSALSLIEEQLRFVLGVYGAENPDPVEWAYYLVALLCAGKHRVATKHAEAYPTLQHPHLDLARRAVRLLSRCGNSLFHTLPVRRSQYSIHRLPIAATENWIEQISIMLTACKRFEMAETLRVHWRNDDSGCEPPPTADGACANGASRKLAPRKRLFRVPRIASARTVLTSQVARHPLYPKLAAAIRRSMKVVLHRLEAKTGYFLPYCLSSSKEDELFERLRELARSDDVNSILVLGTTLKSRSIEAIMAGAGENGGRPFVFCAGFSIKRRVQRAIHRYAASTWLELSGCLATQLSESIRTIKEERGFSRFDIVLVSDCDPVDHSVTTPALRSDLLGVTTVVLEGLMSPSSFAAYEMLLSSPEFELTSQNPGLRNGYAIFTKAMACAANSSVGYIQNQVSDADEASDIATSDCGDGSVQRPAILA
jgi:hypothetical protein